LPISVTATFRFFILVRLVLCEAHSPGASLSRNSHPEHPAQGEAFLPVTLFIKAYTVIAAARKTIDIAMMF